MMRNVDVLANEVLRLPPNERAALAARILASLEESDESASKASQLASRKSSRLALFLTGLGIPPVRLAHESGLTRRYVRDLYEGKTAPTARHAAELAAAVGRILGRRVRPAELFDNLPKSQRRPAERS
jgi:hypothetical protein